MNFKIPTVCPRCGKTFLVFPYRLKLREHVCCSKSCAISLQPHPSNQILIACHYCGKLFKRQPNQIKRAKKYFCSRKCKEIGLIPPIGKESLKWKRIDVLCTFCGKVLSLSPHRLKSQNHFCNSKCKGKWTSKNWIGFNHPAWRGGYQLPNGVTWRRQRDKARERDGYKCQNCGISESEIGHELDVHHIFPFSSFLSEKKANSLSNLISLCHKCHEQHKSNKIKLPRFLRLPLFSHRTYGSIC